MALRVIAGDECYLFQHTLDALFAQDRLHSFIDIKCALPHRFQNYFAGPGAGGVVQHACFTVEVVGALQLSIGISPDIVTAGLSVAVFLDPHIAAFGYTANVGVVFGEFHLATDFHAEFFTVIAVLPLHGGLRFVFGFLCIRADRLSGNQHSHAQCKDKKNCC